jgi:hypothetical protein
VWVGPSGPRYSALVEALAAACEQEVHKLSPNKLAKVLMALARMGRRRDTRLLLLTCQEAAQKIGGFGPGNLVVATYGIWKLQHQDHRLMELIRAQANEVWMEFSPKQKNDLDLALQRYGNGIKPITSRKEASMNPSPA